MRYITIIIWAMAGVISPAAAQTLEVTYTGELQYSPSTLRVNFCNLLRTDWNMPVYKNGEFSAATLHFYKVNSKCVLEDQLTFSNIEESNIHFALAIFGYTHKLGKSTLFLGVRNMNEDYFNSPITSFLRIARAEFPNNIHKLSYCKLPSFEFVSSLFWRVQ